MPPMLFIAELICTEDACAETAEAVGHLLELESLVCECGCTMQPLSISGFEESRAELWGREPLESAQPLAA